MVQEAHLICIFVETVSKVQYQSIYMHIVGIVGRDLYFAPHIVVTKISENTGNAYFF